MPRRNVDVKKRIFKALTEKEKLTWKELLEKSKISRGSLSKFLRILGEDFVERIVDPTTKPPTVHYKLKEIHKMPNKLRQETKVAILEYKTRFFEQVNNELKQLREKGIVELENPDNAINNMYAFWYQDFLFTLHWGSQAPSMFEATELLKYHVNLYQKIMWQIMVRCAKLPEWKESLEKHWKEYQELIERTKREHKEEWQEYLKQKEQAKT